ncbi:MAG TPA: outer membrane beta-barrel protein [Gemmatimonadaceae bacterium]|nr:outer membrane beta-barrel protein [Gemmatimonadaceae bacterium]
MGRNSVALAALALGVFAASSANAQATSSSASGVSFGISAGLAMPTGDLKKIEGTEIANNGFTVAGQLGYQPASMPVGFRVDAGYTRFGVNKDLADDANFSIISGIVNALVNVPMSGSVTPYALAGVGFGSVKVSGEGESESSTGLAYDVGAGLRFNLSGMATNLEAKYVANGTDKDKILIDGANSFRLTFGIMFGGK